MKKLVIYHAHCSDGFCAAWLFARAFPDAELFPANYGDEPPDVRDRDVFILDFSYPRAVMLRLIEQARGHVTVIDHHESAERELAGLCSQCYQGDTLHLLPEFDVVPSITFDMKKSGAMLAWEYLKTRPQERTFTHCPWLVEYVQARDLWTWDQPYAREVNAAIRSLPQTMEAWNELCHHTPMSLVPEGAAILRDQAQTVAAHVAKAWDVEIGGHKVKAVNATTMISEIAGELAKDAPFGACFQIIGGKVIWSLRSREGGIDVSEVAKQFKGGGHRSAAGFQMDLSDESAPRTAPVSAPPPILYPST